LQEQNVRSDFRVGVFRKCTAWQADRAQQVGALGEIFAHCAVLLVQCAFGCDERDNTARSHLIQRFRKKVVVNEKIARAIPRFRQLVAAKRHIADGKVKGIIRQRHALKAVYGDIRFRVKLPCDPSADAVQFHAVQRSVLVFLRQTTEEVANTHCRFQNGFRLDAHTGKSLIHFTNDHRCRVVRVQGGAARRCVFLRSQQRFQFGVFCRPFLVALVKRLRDAAPAGIAGKDSLLLRRGASSGAFQFFQ